MTSRSWRVPFGIAAVAQTWMWLNGLTLVGDWIEYTGGTLVNAIVFETVFVLAPLYTGAIALGEHRATQGPDPEE